MSRRSVSPKLKRQNKVVITLNDRELQALHNYCTQMKIRSRTDLLRRIIMSSIITDWEHRTPMLFDEAEMQ